MTKNIVSKPIRSIESAPLRTRLYIRALHRKNGLSVAEMRDAVLNAVEAGKIAERRGEAFTPHNTYSLGLLAATYGEAFVSFRDAKGDTRYMFRSDKNAETFDAHKKDFAAMQSDKIARKAKAEREAAKAERLALAEREAKKALREAVRASKAIRATDDTAQASKPARASRKAAIDVVIAEASLSGTQH